ncbi:transport ATP-binding protein CydC [Vibrio maritimus]|uniref:Transport ATP-binding protein CydC n=1 Tax=Vibrio maritimus TaxID=990268 RepID=A0A090TT00_9VIBR|nr:transport ATP-binding protein CydC [Vibrio maritimus]
MVVGAFGILCLTAVLCWFDAALGLTLGAVLMLLLLIWPTVFYRLGKKNGEALTLNKAELRIKTLDWLQGYSELTLFGAESRYRNAILSAQDELIKNQFVHAKISGLAQGLLILANGWLLILMLWLAADGVGGNQPDPLIALMAFATMASFELLMPIAGAFQYLGQTLTSAKRLNEVILAKPDVNFPQEDTTHSDAYSIKLNQASFGYPGANQMALRDIDLDVPAGQKLAVVGQTGSGKSTLLQLITRYWDVQKGSIELAGENIQSWSEAQLRQSTSVVSQKVDILNGTLRDNLSMAKPDATDEELTAALVNVDLGHLTEETGLDAWLGEGGRQLSGGEKRRVGIARALLHDAPVLLLDEPTEGLDKKTEQQIMALFETQFTGKTVVFITHRLVSLESFDQVCLLEDGEVLELGHHDELLSRKGRYFELHQTL